MTGIASFLIPQFMFQVLVSKGDSNIQHLLISNSGGDILPENISVSAPASYGAGDDGSLKDYISDLSTFSLGFPSARRLRIHLLMQKTQVRSLGREDPLKRERQPTPVFLLGESHGQRSLVGYSP